MQVSEVAGYSWQGSAEKAWERLEEDSSGRLLAQNALSAYDQTLQLDNGVVQGTNVPLRRGVIRYVVLVMDLSKQMDEVSPLFVPNYLGATLEALQSFVETFFENNPLSYMAIITSKEGRASILSPLSSIKSTHLQALTNKKFITGVDYSLQNSLILAHSTLRFVPKYFSKEILVIQSSLSTCDPSDIFDTLEELTVDKVRVSCIGLTAEMFICKKACDVTSGVYVVAKNKDHLMESLAAHLQAPAVYSESSNREDDSLKALFIGMGFPNTDAQHPCCAKCASPFKSLPAECEICGIHLINSSELAKSYHHLYPVSIFHPTKPSNDAKAIPLCYACNEVLTVGISLSQCPKCSHLFCLECDKFIHDTLHNCPGCPNN